MISARPPAYIPDNVLQDPHISFRWDDWKASEDFRYDPAVLLATAVDLTPRARIALTIGFYEFVIWRLRFACPDQTPFQVAEAAWCATVDTRYMIYYEFDRRLWTGPVRGPLWCAMAWLMPAVLLSREAPEELESGISYLARLAHHIIRDQLVLDDWQQLNLTRLRAFFPAIPDDPFVDLFDRHEEKRLGPLVPPQALDPSFPFLPEMADRLMGRFLQTVDYSSNPFLRAPDVLLREGFAGEPYRLRLHGAS